MIESTLRKPLHQRSEILAHDIFVELGKRAALLLGEVSARLRRVAPIALTKRGSGPFSGEYARIRRAV